MENKEILLKAIEKDNGRHDEEILGEQLGFDPDTTAKLISQLLAEYKIEFKTNGLCNYTVARQMKK